MGSYIIEKQNKKKNHKDTTINRKVRASQSTKTNVLRKWPSKFGDAITALPN